MTVERIYLIDDHEVFLLGLKTLIEKNNLSKKVRTFLKERDFLHAILEEVPDMVIVDHILKETTGIELISKAKQINSNIKSLLVSSVEDSELKDACIENGIGGYIYKSELHTNIISAISTIIDGEAYFSNIKDSTINARAYDKINPFSLLTDRELQVVHYLIQGLSYKEISDSTLISIKTVQQHCYNITQKLGKMSRLQLAQRAYKWGIINNLEGINFKGDL